MRLHKFNKNKSLNKLTNRRNNSNLKVITVSISVVLLIGAIIYFSFARYESSYSFNLIDGTIANSSPMTISDKLISLASKGATDLSYDGTSTLGELGTPDNNLRYIGANPSNYIYYNCSTTNPNEMNDETCEKWRIIGLFNNIEDKNGNSKSRVKIIKDEPLLSSDTYYPWDVSDSSINSGAGINQWGESTHLDGTPYEGADLMRELNTDYLGNITIGTDGKWYSDSGNYRYTDMPTKLLETNAQNMIQTVKWHTGAVPNETTSNWTTKNMYEWERNNNIGYICNESDVSNCKDDVVRTTTWIGKVALIYPSDYSYATSGNENMSRNDCLNMSVLSDNNNCRNNNWLNIGDNYWTLTPFYIDGASNTISRVAYYGPIGYMGGNMKYKIRPSLYLKNNIFVNGGDGTSSNPYKLVQGESASSLKDKVTELAASGDEDLAYDGTATLGSTYGTSDNNIRYVGADPKNYVYFNCSTNKSSEMDDTTCEKWRIIGVMNNVEDENGASASRIKIVRNDSLGLYSWDTSESTINTGYGINQWGASGTYEGADLMRELNTDYLGNTTVGTDNKWYSGINNAKTANMPSKVLYSDYVSMIDNVKWYTGAISAADLKAYQMYSFERGSGHGKTACSSGDSCNDDVNRTTTWIGKVGLINLSDYTYSISGNTNTTKEDCLNTKINNLGSASDCNSTSWINTGVNPLWTINPRYFTGIASYIGVKGATGDIFGKYAGGGDGMVKPTVYLNENVAFTSGDGSSSNPYKLTM